MQPLSSVARGGHVFVDAAGGAVRRLAVLSLPITPVLAAIAVETHISLARRLCAVHGVTKVSGWFSVVFKIVLPEPSRTRPRSNI